MRKHREGWGCIYSAVNRFKDLEYIGKDGTGDPENHRWKHHCREALRDKPRSYFAWGIKNAGGFVGFKWSVIWRGPMEELATKEVYYIAKRHTWVGDSKCRGYNLTIGGDGVMSGRRHSKKAIKKISEASKRQWAKPGARRAMSDSGKRRYENPAEHKRSSVAAKLWYENPGAHEIVSKAQTRRWAAATLEDVSVISKKCSFAAQHQWAVMTPKERTTMCKKYSDAAKRRYTNTSKKAQAMLNKKYSKAAKHRWAAMSSEERSRIGIKARDTRRRNAAKLKKK